MIFRRYKKLYLRELRQSIMMAEGLRDVHRTFTEGHHHPRPEFESALNDLVTTWEHYITDRPDRDLEEAMSDVR